MTQSAAMQADFCFVHFTDTHIMAGGPYTPSTGGWHVDTTASLQRVITVKGVFALQAVQQDVTDVQNGTICEENGEL